MAKSHASIFGLAAFIALGGLVHAQQETSHYPPGVEGLKCATLPPPGKYLKWYNISYTSNTLRDGDGDSLPVDLDLNVFATVVRPIWITDHKIFGGDYGLDIAIPFINVDLEVDALGVDDTSNGLYDILIEPFILAWHYERLDLLFGFSLWMPTGDFDASEPTNPGKGFWTPMFTVGATYYFDKEKKWHLSAMPRYETNTRKDGIDVRVGDDFHIEWGLGKTVCKGLDIGLTAYTHWQVTDDRGSDVTWDADVHDRFYSIGPEIVYFCEPRKLFISFRYQHDFGVRDRTEDDRLFLSVVKIF